ncbi:MAG: molybdenum cofactor biosynthesis protein MoaE [Dehalococcoidia bacterium]|nr:molybdenum cofactor biosynthesis protein MoaE [Dehalococcoidia bacterium]
MTDKDLLEVTSAALNPAAIISRVMDDDGGAVAVFIGKVRGVSEGRRVATLEHDAGPEAAGKLLQSVVREMRGTWPLGKIAFSYRTGPVEAGEVTAVVAVSAVHRQEAFAACQHAMDCFKGMVTAREVLEDE